MSDLSAIEKRKLERLFQMGGGYVLDFSNNTLDEFFIETITRSPGLREVVASAEGLS